MPGPSCNGGEAAARSKASAWTTALRQMVKFARGEWDCFSLIPGALSGRVSGIEMVVGNMVFRESVPVVGMLLGAKKRKVRLVSFHAIK